MITTAALKEYTLKDLAQMAKKRGITGWHSMRKQDLIRAIVRDAKSVATREKNGSKGNGKATRKRTVTASGRGKTVASTRGKAATSAGRKPTAAQTKVARRIQKQNRQQDKLKDISGAPPKLAPRRIKPKPELAEAGKDRVVLMVRDPFWLHAHWELSSRCIQRAQAAMAEYWHTAKPVLRLIEISNDVVSSPTEVHVRDIQIHGGVNNWYIDVNNPPKGYRIEIGYLASNERFHAVARSNSVTTPRPGSCDAMDENWSDVAENCERIFALSGGYSSDMASEELQEVLEERLRRPVGSPMVTRYGVGAAGLEPNAFDFDVEAEMIIYGSTKSDAHVTLGGEPIKLRPDGTFTIRMSMPDRRQVLPVTSSSSDGTTQQTIVLAVERNTKVMEPVLRDSGQ
ncbi:MAG: DUF4912 domain-containing protein [Pirellulaceae bacterium]|nr:DUF4912 domain-containing protein [Pirellulaceae bacterium]